MNRKFPLYLSVILCLFFVGACSEASGDVDAPPAPQPTATEVIDEEATVAAQATIATANTQLASIPPEDVVRINFWSSEFQTERVERQRAMIAAFELTHPGVQIELTVMDENLMDQLMVINRRQDNLPDVILHPLQLSAKWYIEGLLDGDYATQVVDDLGSDTFAPGALALLERPDADGWVAIPSDGWGQMLIYRKDLFEAAGLNAPDSYADILTAAAALHDPDNGFVGFLGPNDPDEVYTWQVFEHLALANGATFVDAEGNVAFNTSEMIEAIQFYADLMNQYGPGEDGIYWQQTRDEYLAGRGAMTIWSPFILDEMAGLRDSVFPTCAECTEDPAFIARNSGVVSAISGPRGDNPAAWGSVFSMGIAPGAPPEAQAFLRFWFNEAYVDALAIAPEGKFPMRRGTADESNLFVEAWEQLNVGVDRKAALSDFYDADTLAAIIAGSDGYTRMGFDVGQSVLASAVGAQMFIQENLIAVLNGEKTAEQAAEDIQAEILALQQSLLDAE